MVFRSRSVFRWRAQPQSRRELFGLAAASFHYGRCARSMSRGHDDTPVPGVCRDRLRAVASQGGSPWNVMPSRTTSPRTGFPPLPARREFGKRMRQSLRGLAWVTRLPRLAAIRRRPGCVCRQVRLPHRWPTGPTKQTNHPKGPAVMRLLRARSRRTCPSWASRTAGRSLRVANSRVPQGQRPEVRWWR